MILLLGQTRVSFAMSRDRLLPSALGAVHPRFGTPYRFTLLAGIIIAIIATFVPLSTLAELVNIGTLFAFMLVALGVIILRRTRPDLKRSFRVPFVLVVPILGIGLCSTRTPQDTVLEFMRAFREQDASLALALIADDFTFTSPQDDHLDRDAWLERCFPTADHFDAPATTLQIVEIGGVVLHRFEYSVAGRTYGNVEAIRVQDGLVHGVEVYFGGAVQPDIPKELGGYW